MHALQMWSCRKLAALLTVGLGACGSDGGHSNSMGGAGGTGGSGGTDAGGNTIAMSGLAHEWSQTNLFSSPGLSGVEVCLYQHPEVSCTTSAADGSWTLRGVPASSHVMVTFKKAGYVSTLRPIVSRATDMALQAFEGVMVTTAGVSNMLPGVTIDLTKGGITFFMNRPGTRFRGIFDWLTGFTVTASPTSGNGPLYTDANETLVPNATSSQGGVGSYVNMSAGTYALTFRVPAGVVCTTWAGLNLADAYGYPTAQLLTIEVPVVDGFMTGPVGIYCPTVPPSVTDAGPG